MFSQADIEGDANALFIAIEAFFARALSRYVTHGAAVWATDWAAYRTADRAADRATDGTADTDVDAKLRVVTSLFAWRIWTPWPARIFARYIAH